MEIVKKLSLNKDYQNIENGSLVFAKNMRVSDDYSYLTNDYGFIDSILVEEGENHPLEDMTIVSVIPCNKELVIFTVGKDKHGKPTNNIVRLKEVDVNVDNIVKETRLKHVKTWTSTSDSVNGWHYHGGVITGTYSYNVEHQLIIAFSEYDGEVDTPLKVINLDTYDNTSSEDKYTPAPDIPVANLKLNKYVKTKGIPNGVYYFFVRYKISHNNYTDWFPIGGVYYAFRRENTTIIDHRYNVKSTTENNHHSARTLVLRGVNNVSKDSNVSFEFNLSISNTTLFNECEIGYILQKENGNFGRVWKSFDIKGKSNITFTFDSNFRKEIGVDNLVANAFQIYNAKHLSNYEGRLYVANYKETDYNTDLTEAAKNVKLHVNKNTASGPNHARGGTFEGDRSDKNTDTVNLVTYRVEITPDWATSINKEPQSVEISVPMDEEYIRIGDYRSVQHLINAASVWRINTLPEWDSRNAQNVETDGNGLLTIMPLGGLYLKLPIVTTTSSVGNSTLFNHYIKKSDGNYLHACPNAHYVCLNAKYLYEGNKIPDECVAYFGKEAIKITVVGVELNVDPTANNEDNVKDDYGSNTEYPIGTLMPGEYYQFFVHFVRKDGTYTNGYLIKHNQVIAPGSLLSSDSTNNVCQIRFQKDVYHISLSSECSAIPEGFVGYFISYAKPETTVLYQGYCIGSITADGAVETKFQGERDEVQVTTNKHLKAFKASEVEIGLVAYSVDKFVSVNDNTTYNTYTTDDMGIIMSGGSTIINGNKISCHNGDGKIVAYLNNEGMEIGLYYGAVDVDKNSIYSNTSKELIRLGDIVTDTATHEFLPEDSNYPSYIVIDECVRIYANQYEFSEDGEIYRSVYSGGNTLNKEELRIEGEYAGILTFRKYSNFNLYAMSFKKPPVTKSTIIGIGKNLRDITSTIVRPNDLTDLFHLESAFIPNNLKAYANYNQYDKYSNHKTNVVRRSDIISDESLETSWRLFRANNYKVIPSDKGIITNIVGAGNVFLIHCEHTLLAIDRSQLLKTNDKVVQTAIPDTFEVEPMDLFTSQHGYGGLQIINAWCLNHYGYFFLDSDSRKIFNYDNNQINDLTPAIVNWFKNKNFIRANFVTDLKTNRIFIRLVYKDESVKDNEDSIVFSYNAEMKSFISIHDFDFGVNCSTKDNAYFIKDLPQTYTKDNSIMIMSDTITRAVYDSFTKANEKLFAQAVYVEGRPQQTVSYASIVDIIFNPRYEAIKTLESISYILSNELDSKPEDSHSDYDWFGEVRKDDIVTDKLFDEDKYSGNMLRIYSDATDSGVLDIDINSLDTLKKGENLNKEYETPSLDLSNSYKYPYYDKGIWHLNYFRNIISNYVRNEELRAKAKAIVLRRNGVTEDKLTKEQKEKLEELITNYIYSDQMSLLYGKYFVLRFIFNNNVPIKFENVDVNLKLY